MVVYPYLSPANLLKLVEDFTSMKTGAEHWNAEYSLGSPHFQALASDKPSNAAIRFTEYLRKNQIPFVGKVLETGCGMGRNSNYLAGLGFEVTGVDISDVAITEARKRAAVANLSVQYRELDVSTAWPFVDQSIDYVLDLGTSHLLTMKELQVYREELLRVLKLDGKFLLYTLDRSKDQESQKLLKEAPGPEANTYIIPEMGHLERALTLEEITNFYQPLQVESSALIYLPTHFGSEVYETRVSHFKQ